MTKTICILAGARPNFIKVSPLVRAIGQRPEASCLLVYAGSADDPTLEPSLFDDLQIERPKYYLGVVSTSLNEITSQVMAQFDRFLDEHPVDVVIVVDDLASTMAAAIVTKKRGIRLAHLVAGTRSFDITMPKEINRLVIDALSDYLFTAGVRSTGVATREQSEQSQTYMVGNILMDTLRFNRDRLRRPASLPDVKEGEPMRGVMCFDNMGRVERIYGNVGGCVRPERFDTGSVDGVWAFTEETFRDDAVIIDRSQLRQVSLLDKTAHPVVTVDFQAPAVGIWSPYGKNAPFVCIEPWYGLHDWVEYQGEFKEKYLMNHLQPGASFMSEYVITIK